MGVRRWLTRAAVLGLAVAVIASLWREGNRRSRDRAY